MTDIEVTEQAVITEQLVVLDKLLDHAYNTEGELVFDGIFDEVDILAFRLKVMELVKKMK